MAAEVRKRLIVAEGEADTAAERHNFDEAALLYEAILTSSDLPAADYSRICEKLANALFSGNTPNRAEQWFQRALTSYQGNPESTDSAIRTLLRIARHKWVASRTASQLTLVEHAMELAEGSKNPHIIRRVTLVMANACNLLGRYADARGYLGRVAISATDDAELRELYFGQYAIVEAACGARAEAEALFREALSAASGGSHPYLLTRTLDDFALWAVALGNIHLASEMFERALTVAREQHVTWRIPYESLRYAGLLMLRGAYGEALGHFWNAANHPMSTSNLQVLFASTGIPIALHFGDRAALERCCDTSAIALAFESGEPIRIAATSAAFARYYHVRGRSCDIPALLDRAIACITTADHAWDLLFAVAQYGSGDAVRTARGLLDDRARLGSPNVALACLAYFDALTRRRMGHAAGKLFAVASARFSALEWHSYAQGALQSDGVALTRREGDVATLAARGMTNRAIAERLGIRENTVESHISSALSRLGIRSRWQLVDAVAGVNARPEPQDEVYRTK